MLIIHVKRLEDYCPLKVPESPYFISIFHPHTYALNEIGAWSVEMFEKRCSLDSGENLCKHILVVKAL